MLGSLSEADDVVQEAWLRMDRTDISDIRNPRGWLTTVVARICLDTLRARSAHPEQPLDETLSDHVATDSVGPEQEAELADSIGVALLVILQTLSPAERLAFVLHADAAAAGRPTTIRGARAVAANARMFSDKARFAEAALVDGAVGIVVAPKGRLAIVLCFRVTDDKITEIDIVAEPDRLRGFSLAVLD